MSSSLLRLLVTCLLTVLAAGTQAASISLSPTSPHSGLSSGDLVTFDVMMDFSTDTNGLGSDITLGGAFDVAWDSTKLMFSSLTVDPLGDPSFYTVPILSPGLLQGWGFFDFNGLTGPARVGTVTLQVLPTLGSGSAFVSTAPANLVGHPFVSGVDFVTILNVDYNSVEVSGVSSPDADLDGVPDSTDNCTLHHNGSQRDSNGDGFGNDCDPDLDDNCAVNFFDLNIFKQRLFTNDPDADFDGDGGVNFADLSIMKQFFFSIPGPSALAICP